jgi:hypothetical protein
LKNVACPPPGIGAEISRKFLRAESKILTPPAVLLLECGVINLKITTADRNSTALGVPCGPPGIGAKI